MNLELLKADRKGLLDKLRSLVNSYSERNEDFSDEDKTEFDRLESEVKSLDEKISTAERRVETLQELERSGSTSYERDGGTQSRKRTNNWDLSELRFDVAPSTLRGRAQKAIEEDEFLPDVNKEAAVRVLRSVDRRGELATLVLVTGSPAYRSGFQKVVSGNEWALDQDERGALLRAQSLSNASGGFAVPFTLDPTIIVTNDGVLNPLRQLATVKTITTEDWNGVTSAGATAHWRGEAEQVDDDSIALAQPSIPVHKMDVFVPYSIEIEQDWPQLESELRAAMLDAKERKEATSDVLGTGTNQPTGVITALVGTSSVVTPAVAETFAQTDVFNLRRQLPPRHRMSREQPSWLANLGTYDAIRQFDTGGGGGFWTDMTDGTPDRLLGYATYEASEMDDVRDNNNAVTADNYVLLVGDFKKFYKVDRVGMRVEAIPHLFGTANNRPTGQRGLYSMLRTGSDVVDDNAFRLLNVATTA